MKHPVRSARHAFTLIELLIVVAIIAILAAIAVPNFLEVQTRAKVSRAKTDMRSVATALEAYFVDSNQYALFAYPGMDPVAVPPVGGGPAAYLYPWSERMIPLTTPIAYISTPPFDPFKHNTSYNTATSDDEVYIYCRGDTHVGWPNYGHKDLWMLQSSGPDRNVESMSYWTLEEIYANASNPGVEWAGVYDPTNGTSSGGDIYRYSDKNVDETS